VPPPFAHPVTIKSAQGGAVGFLRIQLSKSSFRRPEATSNNQDDDLILAGQRISQSAQISVISVHQPQGFQFSIPTTRFSLCLRASVVGVSVFRSRRCRAMTSMSAIPTPRHSSHPIPLIPIWRGFQRSLPQLLRCSPRLRVSVVGVWFCISDQCHQRSSAGSFCLVFAVPITRLPTSSITQSGRRPYPRHSSHPIPLIPIWREFQHLGLQKVSPQSMLVWHSRPRLWKPLLSLVAVC
jgi:hypothetical protein